MSPLLLYYFILYQLRIEKNLRLLENNLVFPQKITPTITI